jgi:hypothetical protein
MGIGNSILLAIGGVLKNPILQVLHEITKPLWTESPEVSKGMKFPAYSSIIALVS